MCDQFEFAEPLRKRYQNTFMPFAYDCVGLPVTDTFLLFNNLRALFDTNTVADFPSGIWLTGSLPIPLVPPMSVQTPTVSFVLGNERINGLGANR